ncbi:Cobalamin biosynthesis protein CobD [Zhongshania aliphaticivorans]|uniref:Cobalamin biosynthesis protein CobD n=1 Tax=Zhongshania aliphaticivorans TaxID=1470434 RepID=A0A5S9NBW7_9GAMM|nr:adenosylcobinamide-phosphate synthase CbiB [Zhongshania aliphaticivorans]CAA0087531.1 Cobalamin biosynthesis protein CobD [Zhongshania aliphaticivorans]CAA0115060.1 Cobalamin biosynthesis protein CobD [Zhongshania aliphaticivorans]CAA0119869.1 Cobalamin biosynthesis protein CobD [Zhongshania aliphaticivorans]
MLTATAYVAAVCLSSVLLDRLLGELRSWHPLVGFGNAAKWLERLLNRPSSAFGLRALGVLAWFLLVLPPVLLAWLLRYYLAQYSVVPVFVLDVLILYWAIGWRSLCEHIRPIGLALAAGDVSTARVKVGYLVSRDTAGLDEEQILAASMETTLENSNDALFGSLFWFAVAGPAGVVLHRLANTLDAMWGYKNSRYYYYGWWAARSDDLLNFIPAQLTAFGFSVLALSRRGFVCWFGQGWRWKSINAGSVMASGAASLNVRLGGEASYHGETRQRADLGCGSKPAVKDIERSIALINRLLVWWFIVLLMMGVLV